MRIPFAPLPTRQNQDLALRLQFAALRRASDEARRTDPDRNRWIAPDTAPLLDALLANESRDLEAVMSVEQRQAGTDTFRKEHKTWHIWTSW